MLTSLSGSNVELNKKNVQGVGKSPFSHSCLSSELCVERLHSHLQKVTS